MFENIKGYAILVVFISILGSALYSCIENGIGTICMKYVNLDGILQLCQLELSDLIQKQETLIISTQRWQLVLKINA